MTGHLNGRNEMFREGVAAEEQSHVEGIPGEGVPEKGKAGQVASGQAGGGFWVGIQEPPDCQVGEEEELGGAEERCCADAENASAILQEAADEDAEEKTGVDHRDEPVKADE